MDITSAANSSVAAAAVEATAATLAAPSVQNEREAKAAQAEVEHLVAAWQKASDEFKTVSDIGAEHYGLHRQITRDVTKLHGLFQALEADDVLSATTSECKPRSQPTVAANVGDGMSSLPIPPGLIESTEVTSKPNYSVNAEANSVTEGASVFSMDQSTPYKNTDIEINEIMMNCLIHDRGQRVFFLLSDMGPLLYTAAIYVFFMMFLTDMGFCDMVICAHLSSAFIPSDMATGCKCIILFSLLSQLFIQNLDIAVSTLCFRFGLMQSLMARAISLSHEAWGKLMSKVMCKAETKEMLEFFRVNVLAMTKFKAYLAGLYTCSSIGGGLREWFMDDLQRHWFCSVRPGAMSGPSFMELIHKKMHVSEVYPSYSMFDVFGKMIPLEDGWLGSCYSLDEEEACSACSDRQRKEGRVT